MRYTWIHAINEPRNFSYKYELSTRSKKDNKTNTLRML
ncbi:hypothetical protein BMETH_180_4 [methanotrophic bacterial endosymbiont of Bathymodiolus sp.]|nr:hypothetical protein BMETH_180_4 [methanotrophic bacterial endosymbiont of Bathymodiolus sp.]